MLDLLHTRADELSAEVRERRGRGCQPWRGVGRRGDPFPASSLRFSSVAKEVDAAVNRLATAGTTLGAMLAGVQGRRVCGYRL